MNIELFKKLKEIYNTKDKNSVGLNQIHYKFENIQSEEIKKVKKIINKILGVLR